ncbi:MAG: hypothetical protein GC147_01675 [Porphyrobacter sp.]|nr:hypothetical protein [Porphyrobacter sp.]
MKRALLHLGRTPRVRRIIAAALLLGGALVTSVLRGPSDPVWVEPAFNLFAACVAFAFLHFRWRAREKREITPDRARDIFS